MYFIYLHCKTSVDSLLTWLAMADFTCSLLHARCHSLNLISVRKLKTTLHDSSVMSMFSFNCTSVRHKSPYYVPLSAATRMGDTAGITNLHDGNSFTSLFPAYACTTNCTTAVASLLDRALSCLRLLSSSVTTKPFIYIRPLPNCTVAQCEHMVS